MCVPSDLREILAVKWSDVAGRRAAGMDSVSRKVQLTTSACKSELMGYLMGISD